MVTSSGPGADFCDLHIGGHDLSSLKKLSFPKSIILISDLLREVAVVGCCVISRGDIPSHEDGQPD